MTDLPITGGCNCGAVRFEVRAPFQSAGYCHCTRCQRRTGTSSAASAVSAARDFAIVEGAESVRVWHPEGGFPKAFCVNCGGHLYSGDRDGDGIVGVRLGAIDGDPGIRPQWRQWLSSAVSWEEIPDDGLTRYEELRPR